MIQMESPFFRKKKLLNFIGGRDSSKYDLGYGV